MARGIQFLDVPELFLQGQPLRMKPCSCDPGPQLDPQPSLTNAAQAVFGGIVSVGLFLGQVTELCRVMEWVQRDYRMFSV